MLSVRQGLRGGWTEPVHTELTPDRPHTVGCTRGRGCCSLGPESGSFTGERQLVLENGVSSPEAAYPWSCKRAQEVFGVAGAGRAEDGRVGGSEAEQGWVGWGGALAGRR